MRSHKILKAVAVMAAAPSAALLIAGSASAAPSPTLSFSSSTDGASAGWSHGKGSAIDLTLGSNSASTFAMVTFHHFAPATVGTVGEPQFATDNYAAGSPRFYITLDDGDTLWGYPSNAGVGSTGSHLGWAIDNGNTYQSWADVQSTESSANVTGAYVIADGDQGPGTTDTITSLSFDGVHFNS